MAEENVDTVKRIYEQYQRTGEQDYTVFDPEVVWDLSRSSFPDAGVYRGVEGVKEWFDGLADAFGDVHYEIEDVRAHGERVAVLLHVSGRGPSSGLGVDYRFVPIFSFRGGKIFRMDRYDDWAEALEAAGLSE
jgi:ketosteroid isomerase-like protein